MSLNDLTGIGKLFKEVRHLVIHFDEPGHIVRVAKARAEATMIEAAADAYVRRLMARGDAENSNSLTAGDMPSLEILTSDETSERQIELLVERSVASTVRNLIREELNKQNVFNIAAETLESTSSESVSDTPVEPDWLSRLFELARHVSDEKMQELLGRILAGEVVRPGSYSLRTLDVLRNMSKEEAQTFLNISKWAIQLSSLFFIEPKSIEAVGNDFAAFGNDMVRLEDAGIVRVGLSVQLREASTFLYDGYVLRFDSPDPLSFDAVLFTRAGAELLKLTSPQPSRKYILEFARVLGESGSVELATIKRIHPDGFVEHNNDAMKLDGEVITRLVAEDEIVDYFVSHHKQHQEQTTATPSEIAANTGIVVDETKIAQYIEQLVGRGILSRAGDDGYVLSENFEIWRLSKVSNHDLTPSEPDYLRKASATAAQHVLRQGMNLAGGEAIKYFLNGNDHVQFTVLMNDENRFQMVDVDTREALTRLSFEEFVEWLVKAICQTGVRLNPQAQDASDNSAGDN